MLQHKPYNWSPTLTKMSVRALDRQISDADRDARRSIMSQPRARTAFSPLLHDPGRARPGYCTGTVHAVQFI